MSQSKNIMGAGSPSAISKTLGLAATLKQQGPTTGLSAGINSPPRRLLS